MPFPAARRSPPSHPLSLFGCSLSRAEIPGWRGRIDKSISNLARCSVCGMAMRFIFIVTPWLFFRQIFVPCFDCYDFEAAVLHEVLDALHVEGGVVRLSRGRGAINLVVGAGDLRGAFFLAGARFNY